MQLKKLSGVFAFLEELNFPKLLLYSLIYESLTLTFYNFLLYLYNEELLAWGVGIYLDCRSM